MAMIPSRSDILRRIALRLLHWSGQKKWGAIAYITDCGNGPELNVLDDKVHNRWPLDESSLLYLARGVTDALFDPPAYSRTYKNWR